MQTRTPAVLQTTHKRTVSLMSAASVCVLVTGMAALNPDVRSHVANVVFGDRATELSTMAAPARAALRAATSFVGSYTDAPRSVMAFGIGAVVLFCLMLRM